MFIIRDSKQKLFESLNEIGGGEVILGNNKTWRIQGIGSIRLKMNNGTEIILREVRLVPEFRRNVISLGSLDEEGYTFKVERGILSIYKGALNVVKGNRSNGLYILSWNTIIGSVSAVQEQQENSRTWHLRLAHISEKGLSELHKQGLLGEKPLNQMELCEDCIKGKSTRVKFNVEKHTPTNGLRSFRSLGVHQEYHQMGEQGIS
ncbi:uncharacterized mitochondrial protein AtMg00300-like [Primulina huaijiensis]|uniref:uncharacterized mitochondrial protein AtMg00300-like n=1 Tax=Primulina huaijiensis TaxID=1492673 RepID=UPI003CC70617